MSQLTPWGRLVRDWRVERNMLLGHMADQLCIGSAELSGMECGRCPIPDEIALRVTAMMFPAGPTARFLPDLIKDAKGLDDAKDD